MKNSIRLFSTIFSKNLFLTSVKNSGIKKFRLTRNDNFRASAMTTDMASDGSWRGVPLSEIRGSQSPWGAPEFPLVAPGSHHTVLYHIPSSGLAGDRPPRPQSGHDKWDHEFVRMPCSSQSLYPVEDDSGETHLKKRWEIIESALRRPIRNSEDLAATILSYNTQFKETWKFRALHKLFSDHLEEEEAQYFFDVTLPEIAKLALALPRLIQSPIPLLKQHKNRSISLSQQQISSLLANAFFCTFPRRNSSKKTSEYASFPHINFITLYNTNGSDSVLEKLKCICHYFRRVCSKAPVGVVTVARRSVAPRRCPAWAPSARRVGAVPLHVEPWATIEDAAQLIQMDFANKYLGGGVLGYGCVQEEIRFVICPELMVSMLFTEVLRPNEAVMIIGCERYSDYSGYGASFRWAGAHRDATPSDSSWRRRTAVLALDALPYGTLSQQYRPPAVLRELNKAWVGFSFYTEDQPTTLQYPGIATGNWGCGAFGGSPQLKSLVQLMACAEARRPMAYYTFQDTKIRDEIINVYNLLARYNVTVGQLYHLIVRFCETDVRKGNLHTFIEQALKEDSNPEKQLSAEVPEKMDVANTSNDVVIEIPDSIQRELLKESPDLFADDEIDTEGAQIMDCSEPDPEKSTDTNQIEQATASKLPEEKVAACVNKMAGNNKMATSLTSDLFAEMNKFDQSNGTLNLSQSHTNILKIDEPSKNESDADSSVQLGSKPAEPTSEVKKKMAKKITDYFSKKSI